MKNYYGSEANYTFVAISDKCKLKTSLLELEANK